MIRIVGLVLAWLLIGTSCGKKDSGITNPMPANLTVSAAVATDNSGNVDFVATATNATSYDYDFGNGIFQTTANGKVTYKYPSSGTYTVNVIAKGGGGQTIAKSISITVAVALTLVWSDEFETAGAPSAAKWGYDMGTNGDGWGNNEVQYYTNRAENVSISGGLLKISLLKEAYSGSNYTSARLLTKDKFSFKYGKVEVRAKLPVGGGTWPAIWMLGSNISTVAWPGCGEIDIMEHKGNEPNKIYGTMHHPGHSGGNADGGTTIISNASTEFHRYATEWSASAIKMYVDDQLFYTFTNSASLPFNQNFFLILNVAMGGTFGGVVDAAVTNASMEVDYVRVYQ